MRPDAPDPLHGLRDRHPALSRCVGSSRAIRSVIQDLIRVAATPYPVLLEGESGTGKELIARILHDMWAGNAPFEAVNCGAIPETLLESELFGHVEGAFTGATRPHAGLFERAGAGTVFLDEITEMTPSAQVKLLRVLQEGTFVPVGGERVRETRARVVAASNRDPRREIREGRFREDLYYRISVFPIRLPPLRHRPEDLPALLAFFLEQHARNLGVPRPELSSRALARLAAYPFPGNVRELQNVVGALMIQTHGAKAIEERDVVAVFSRHGLDRGAPEPAAEPATDLDGRPVGEWVLDQLRLHHLNVALAERALLARKRESRDGRGTPVVSRSGLTYYLQGEALKALAASGWDVDDAAVRLAGAQEDAPRARLKIDRLLGHARTAMARGKNPGARLAALRKAFAKLPREYAEDLEMLAGEFERGRWGANT